MIVSGLFNIDDCLWCGSAVKNFCHFHTFFMPVCIQDGELPFSNFFLLVLSEEKDKKKKKCVKS